MIYLDISVALAQLLAKDRQPPPSLWEQTVVSSRLLQYEAWTRLHASRLGSSHGELLRQLLGRVAFVELAQPVLERALQPFPVPLRTLDALHLASIEFLRGHGQSVELASYDGRMVDVARRLGITVMRL